MNVGLRTSGNDSTTPKKPSESGFRPDGFRPDIQGLRALAVLMVLIYHAGAPFVPGGYIGVDVFFVISGFLITQHLLKERVRAGTISLGRFYARRVRRILPAALTVIAATIVACVLILPPLRVVEVVGDAIAATLFVPNIWFGIQGTDYLATTAPSPFQHYWSLGVEEQFYAVWPLLILLVALVWKRRGVVTMLVVVAVASFAASVIMLTQSHTWAYFSIVSRAWEFAIGAFVAWGTVHLAPRLWHRSPAIRAILTWGGTAMIVGSALLYSAKTAFPGAAALPSVIGTALVIAAATSPTRFGADRLLGLRLLQFVGQISYSLYLVHWPALLLASAYLGRTLGLKEGAIVVIASIGVAYLLHVGVERRFIQKGATPRGRKFLARTFATVAVAIVAVLILAGGASAFSTFRLTVPTVSAEGAPNAVPANLRPALAEAAADLPVLYADGCHIQFDDPNWKDCRFGDTSASTAVALFGDSHAANWFPALDAEAKLQHVQLRAFTKSSCGANNMESFRDGVVDVACQQWRDSVIEELLAHPPELIIMGDFAVTLDAAGKVAWVEGIRHTVALLAQTSRVVVMADTPHFTGEIPTCVSGHLDDVHACGEARSAVVNAVTNALTERGTIAAGGEYLDLNAQLCSTDTCRVIDNGILMYRDRHHFTATYSATLAPLFSDLLAQAKAAG